VIKMNIKKYCIVVILLLFVASLFCYSPAVSAKLKNSPQTGYELYLVKNSPYYDKVNGKKKGVIKASIVPQELIIGGDVSPNRVKIIKFVNEYWVKVKFTNKYDGKKNRTGYIKTNHLRASLYSVDYVVSNAPILNLGCFRINCCFLGYMYIE
ncbi:MAG: hypothetical protein KBT36_16285, partial [Kurthia sp.]|nr:hypothetical protein [Candidatus Kurthia equi]